MSQQRKPKRISSQSDIASMVAGINSGEIRLSYSRNDHKEKVSGRSSRKPGVESKNSLNHLFGFDCKIDIGKHSFHSCPAGDDAIIITDKVNSTEVRVPMKDFASLMATKGSVALQRGGLIISGNNLKLGSGIKRKNRR
jgi:hypothetical protein